MKSIISNSKQTEVEKRAGLRGKVVPLLTLLLVIGMMVALFLYRDKVAELGNFGYLGAFLINLVANATIVLPMPGLLLLVGLGIPFNPVLIALAGAAGGAIGEITGYMLGYSGRVAIKDNKMYLRLVGWMRKWGVLFIFVFALVPFFPLDLAGLAAGVLRFSLWKFLVFCFLGKAVLYVGLVWAGAWGWEALLHFFS